MSTPPAKSGWKRTLAAALVAVPVGLVSGVVATAMGAPQGIFADSLREGEGVRADALADLLARKERSLERRERTLEAREADLRAAEAEAGQRLEELGTLRGELAEMLVELDADREARVQGLVTMFEKMRSGQAAAILAETDDDVALEVLDRMNRTKAGRTLASMPPARAAGLAQRLGRAALEPPTGDGT